MGRSGERLSAPAGVRPWRGTGVLAAHIKKKKSRRIQTIDVTSDENVCLSPLVQIKLYFQAAGRFRAASCRRRTCSSWFLPVARAAITATARCSTATCAPWAALRTRAASVGQQSVSETVLTVAFVLISSTCTPSSCRHEQKQASPSCICNFTP